MGPNMDRVPLSFCLDLHSIASMLHIAGVRLLGELSFSLIYSQDPSLHCVFGLHRLLLSYRFSDNSDMFFNPSFILRFS